MTTDAFGLDRGQWRKSERNTTPAPQIITKIWQKHQMLSLHFPHSIYSTIPYIETQHSIMIEIYIYVERHRAAVARGLLLGLMKAFCMNPNLHM